MADKNVLLKFDTLIEGMPVEIDGVRYEIRHPDSLPLWDLKHVEAKAPRLGALLQQDSLAPGQQEEFDTLLTDVCRRLLNAPDEVRARLTDVQKMSVLQGFTQLRSSAVRQLAGAQPTRSLTGARSSRGSAGSTAAGRTSGSRRSRLPS